MPYAALADLIERAGEEEILQVADRDDDGIPDPDVIEAALVHADNLINGYVAVRYKLPLATVPDLLRTWAVAIARPKLHRDGPPDHIQKECDQAIASLKDLAKGMISLPVPVDEPSPVPADNDRVSVSGPEPVFSKEKLGGWL